MNMTQAHERRKFWRATFNAPVNLVTHAASTDVMLDDISLKGALLEVPPAWQGKIGEHCRLQLPLGSGQDMKIIMHGRITHVEGNKVGMLCESLDLDSITHLRRLVELNAGDPTLLERELTALLDLGTGRA
ncbi:MAG: PilZ domain-containing protein [Rhodocyclaceae bacterium]|nr:PilZ domain-containing protein [Rhodocyclaceae bacterium]